MDTDNAYDPYSEYFEFGGPADTGCVIDDGDDFEFGCDCCGEPCHRKAMSPHTVGVCRCCCPVIEARRAAEIAAEELAESTVK